MVRDPNWTIDGEKGRIATDLGYFCQEYLGYGDWDKVHDDLAVWLKDTIDFEKRGRQYVLVALPRGHLKSCIVTKGWGLQQVLRNPNIRLLIANAIWDNARGFLSTIMGYLADEGKIAQVYGLFRPKGKNSRGLSWTNDAITINQRTLPQDAATVTTTGVERTQTSQHYDLIILDDVVVRENISTKEQRDKIKNYYLDCLDLLEPNGIILVVGTTWHHDDLYSAVPMNEGEFMGLLHDPDFKIFKRVAEQGTPESVIFPKKFSFEELMKRRSKDLFSYSSQYLLNPYPEEDLTFKKTWIRYYKYQNEDRVYERIIPVGNLYVSMTLDPSLGKKGGDFAALVTVAIDKDRIKYVLEAKRFKRNLEFIPDEIIKTINMLKSKGIFVNIIGMESFGFQESLYEPIKKGLRAAGVNVPLELLPYANQNSKEERIQGLIAPFSGYEVYLREEQRELMDEMLHFNPKGKNKMDDLLDALAWNKNYWSRIPHKVERRDSPYGSLDWWMKLHRPQEVDLFSEYRDKKVI